MKETNWTVRLLHATSFQSMAAMDLTMQMNELRNIQFRARVRAVYAEFTELLNRAEVAGSTLAPGAAMPEFLLPNAEGQLLSSAELLEIGPLVMTFFSGYWCPFSMLMLAALEKALPDIRGAGATLVAMTPDTGGGALQAKRSECLHFEVLSDVDNEVAMQFGIVVNPPRSYRALLAEFGIDLAEQQGNRTGFLPLPATFIVGSHGIVRQAWIDLDVTRRVEPSMIVASLPRMPLASGHRSPAYRR